MPKYFESKKRESLRLPWWIPLLLLLAAAIVVGILLANMFPDAWRNSIGFAPYAAEKF
jgi:hypothetical protein